MTKIAIIGAGLSGMTLAHELQDFASVICFEKSRGVGGRMATRRAGSFEFDHGTQFFKARHPDFKKWLKPLIHNGIVLDWPARFVELNANGIVSKRSW